MTVRPVSNTAQLIAAMDASVPGDEITMAAGTYGAITRTTGYDGDVIVRAANPATPPTVNDVQWLFSGLAARHYVLDGINFIGTAIESTKNGVDYPLTDEPIRFENGASNCKVRNCLFRFYRNCFKVHKCGIGITLEYNDFEQIGIDPFMMYGSSPSLSLRYNVFRFYRIDPDRRNEASRHPDTAHIRPNAGEIDSNPTANLLIESNYIDDLSGYAKGLFCQNEKNTVGVGFVNPIIRNNHIAIGRYCGIELTGGTNLSVTGNLIRRYTAGVNENPTIFIRYPQSQGVVSNNVTPRAIQLDDGASASNVSMSGNVVSASAVPTGWVTLTPGENVGRYGGGGAPAAPETPDEEWANPPTNTVSKHGRIGAYTEVLPALSPARYTGVLIIPSDSPMFAAACVGSGVVGGPVNNVEWIRPSVSVPKPFRFAVPAFNAAGAVRLEMRPASGGNLDIFSVEAGGTMSGITWRWKEDSGSVWSAMSTYTGGFTATPVTPTLPALTPTQWEFVTSPYEVGGGSTPGRFQQDLRIIPGTGVAAFTAVQWLPEGGDGQWRNMQNVGTDGSSAIIWRMQPLVAGGIEQTVVYDETKSVRLRYGDGTNYSSQSTTAKSFTGPPVPPPVSSYDPGDRLVYGGNNVRSAGLQLTVPYTNYPPAIQTEEGVLVDRAGGTVTVRLPALPPPGATGQKVIYNGIYYNVVDGIATFTAVGGQTVGFAVAHDSSSPAKYGPCLYFFVPGVPPGAPVVDTPPSISTTGKIGSTAVGTDAVWVDADTTALQWQINYGLTWVDLAGATTVNLPLIDIYNGAQVCLRSAGTNEIDTAYAYSPAFTVSYNAPTALNPTLPTISLDGPAIFVPYSDIFAVSGDPSCAGLVVDGLVPVGIQIDDVSKMITIEPAQTGELSTTLTLTGLNSGGSVDSTVTVLIEEDDPLTAPVIGTLIDPMVKDVNTGTRYYNISAAVSGTPVITYWTEPTVAEVTITDNGDGTYKRDAKVFGTPTPTTVTAWELDGVVIAGQTGAVLDAEAMQLSGDLTCEVTATNAHGSDSLESAAVAVDYAPSGGTIVNPVFLGAQQYGGGAAVSHNLPHAAYSAGDLVLWWLSHDSGLATTPNIDLKRISDSTAVGPDSEALTRFQPHVDNGSTGTGGTGGTAYLYTAGANRAAGTLMKADLSSVSDQVNMAMAVFDAGTFDPADPVQNGGTTANVSAGPATSKAFTATKAGGVVCFAFTVDIVSTVTMPAGWTQRTISSGGANTACLATRDALTTAGESVAAASFTLGTSDGWLGDTFVVNPATV